MNDNIYKENIDNLEQIIAHTESANDTNALETIEKIKTIASKMKVQWQEYCNEHTI